MGFLTKIISTLKGRGKGGQHTVEYITVMILVMAGILTMGRYVIRSWNANLKGWEDSALDSMEDPLLTVQAPPPPLCLQDSPWDKKGCGVISRTDNCGTTVTCSDTQQLSVRTYTPNGCQCPLRYNSTDPTDYDTIKCDPDPCCCSIPEIIASCGAAIPTSPAPEPCSNNSMSAPDANGFCPVGFIGARSTCDSGNTWLYGCISDISCGGFICTASIQIPPATKATFCTDDNIGLTQNVPYTLVDACGANKCEYECIAPCTVQSGPTCGLCPNNLVYAGNCPSGQYDSMGCPAGELNIGCTPVTPVPGVCDNSVKYGCTVGTPAVGTTTSSEWQWTCSGIAGGPSSPQCSIACGSNNSSCNTGSSCCSDNCARATTCCPASSNVCVGGSSPGACCTDPRDCPGFRATCGFGGIDILD